MIWTDAKVRDEGQIGCRHFAVIGKDKGATFSRNPLFYLVGWRSLNWFYNYLFYMR
jgi:hypothetical protein